MKAGLIICVAMCAVLHECRMTNSQIVYSNAEVAGHLIRSPTTTTPVPTTKKSSFFGGIRNLFRKETTTVLPLADVPTTPSTPTAVPAPTIASVTPKAVIVPVPTVAPVVPKAANAPAPTITSTTTTTTTTPRSLTSAQVQAQSPTPSTTTTTTTARPRQPLHDFESYATITLSTKAPNKAPAPANNDFPALPPPRRGGVVVPPTAAPAVVTPPNAWSLPTTKPVVGPTPTPSRVSFIPNKTPTTPPTRVTATVSPGEATKEELETLTEALYNKENSLIQTVSVNYQGKTKSSATNDDAPLPLLTVNEAQLNMNPTVAKMKLLYNNYEQDTLVNEHVTAMERMEENDFIDQLLTSSLVRHAMNFLIQKGVVTPDPKTHRDLLKTVWFSLYSRGRGKIGSSAFEHVFVTELRNGTVSGFHNWIYYAHEEEAGNADYHGWLKKTDIGTKANLIKYRFSYKGSMKPVNAMLIGTSPELEMALYTVCFALRADKECPVSLDGNKFNIRTHTFRYRGKNLIGSAFVEF